MTKKLEMLPDLKTRYQADMAAIVRDLNVGEIHARMDQVAKIIHRYVPADRRTRADYASFDDHLPKRKAAIVTLKTSGLLP